MAVGRIGGPGELLVAHRMFQGGAGPLARENLVQQGFSLVFVGLLGQG
jgi:hypothetical protein